MSRISKISPDFSIIGWSVSGVSITHVVDESERVKNYSNLYFLNLLISLLK